MIFGNQFGFISALSLQLTLGIESLCSNPISAALAKCVLGTFDLPTRHPAYCRIWSFSTSNVVSSLPRHPNYRLTTSYKIIQRNKHKQSKLNSIVDCRLHPNLLPQPSNNALTLHLFSSPQNLLQQIDQRSNRVLPGNASHRNIQSFNPSLFFNGVVLVSDTIIRAVALWSRPGHQRASTTFFCCCRPAIDPFRSLRI